MKEGGHLPETLFSGRISLAVQKGECGNSGRCAALYFFKASRELKNIAELNRGCQYTLDMQVEVDDTAFCMKMAAARDSAGKALTAAK